MLNVFDSEKKLITNAPLSKNRISKVAIQMMEHKCLIVAMSREEWIWHYGFGRLNFRELYELKRQGMVLNWSTSNNIEFPSSSWLKAACFKSNSF